MTHAPRSVLLALAATAILLSGCDGDGRSPTSPNAARTMTLTEASVTVDGQVFTAGDTFAHHDDAPGVATRFEATLMDAYGPATGHVVEVRFQRPHGMMNGAGAFRLYDDGTHGDHTPGDGVYCLEDPEGLYGFHHRGAAPGRYHYDFCGLYANGAETNHWIVDVEVVD